MIAQLATGALAGLAAFVANSSTRSLSDAVRMPGARQGSRVSAARAAASRSAMTPPVGPAEVAVLAEQLASLTRAGLPPDRVWRSVAEAAPTPAVRLLAAGVVAAHQRGEPAGPAVLAHLERSSRRWMARPSVRASMEAGSRALRQLVLCLEVSIATGAGYAEVLDRLAVALRQEEQAAQERATALPGPRATAALLVLLPLGGLALGALLGSHPWRVLVGTAPGRVCLLAGVALWLVGRGWSTVLIRRAERSR